VTKLLLTKVTSVVSLRILRGKKARYLTTEERIV